MRRRLFRPPIPTTSAGTGTPCGTACTTCTGSDLITNDDADDVLADALEQRGILVRALDDAVTFWARKPELPGQEKITFGIVLLYPPEVPPKVQPEVQEEPSRELPRR
jgi:hypothetical protein